MMFRLWRCLLVYSFLYLFVYVSYSDSKAHFSLAQFCQGDLRGEEIHYQKEEKYFILGEVFEWAGQICVRLSGRQAGWGENNTCNKGRRGARR